MRVAYDCLDCILSAIGDCVHQTSLWKIQGDMEPELQALFTLRDCSRTRRYQFKLRKMESMKFPSFYHLSRREAVL